MNFMQILFLLVALVTVTAAVKVVTTRRVMHAALWLIVTLMGVAVVFALLESSFFAVVQVVVYIGAIAVLFIFAVMLTRRSMADEGAQVNRNWWAAALASLALAGVIVWVLSSWQAFGKLSAALPEGSNDIAAFGKALVSPQGYVIPFEVSSVLLVAALVGAIYVSMGKRGGPA